MNDKQLAAELRKMKVNTKGLICLGCRYEDKCTIRGCKIINAAAGRLEEIAQALAFLESIYNASNGILKQTYREVLAQFDPWFVAKTPIKPHASPPKYVTGVLVCEDQAVELADALKAIDDAGCRLITATQDAGTYTLFFRQSVPQQE